MERRWREGRVKGRSFGMPFPAWHGYHLRAARFPVPARAPEGPLPGLMLRAQDISLKRRGAPGTLCARSMTIDEQLDILMGGTAVVISREELKERLKLGRPLRVKLGVDPTAPDIHLGHTVAIEKLRQFQELGHQAILLIGDFTATIGDPSGRSVTRPPLSREQVLENAETYTKQAFKILDRDRTEIVYNGDWFRKMTYEEVLKLNSRVTMQQMLAREDFQGPRGGRQGGAPARNAVPDHAGLGFRRNPVGRGTGRHGPAFQHPGRARPPEGGGHAAPDRHDDAPAGRPGRRAQDVQVLRELRGRGRSAGNDVRQDDERQRRADGPLLPGAAGREAGT